MTTIDALIEAGLQVIPLHPKSKRPVFNNWQQYSHKRIDRKTTAAYFHHNPEANAGIVCGPVSNLMVVDFDVNKSDDPLTNHLASIQALEFIKQHPTPIIVQTGSGGYHAYYSYVENTKNKTNIPKLDPSHTFQIDVKTAGGFVVAPPSIHPDTLIDYRFVDPPANLVAAFRRLPRPPSKIVKHCFESPSKLPADWQKILHAPPGARNTSATEVAGALLLRFPPKDWPSLCLPLLQAWNRTYLSPPLPNNELEAVYESIAKAELKRRGSRSYPQSFT